MITPDESSKINWMNAFLFECTALKVGYPIRGRSDAGVRCFLKTSTWERMSRHRGYSSRTICVYNNLIIYHPWRVNILCKYACRRVKFVHLSFSLSLSTINSQFTIVSCWFPKLSQLSEFSTSNFPPAFHNPQFLTSNTRYLRFVSLLHVISPNAIKRINCKIVISRAKHGLR